MPNLGHPIETLADLLQNSDAKPLVVPSRLAPSAIYDVEYRTAVIALLFKEFAKPFGPAGHRRISVARLKLLQFVTLRPWLLPAIREWSRGTSQGSLGFVPSIRIRRGFLSDTAHDDVINFLVACGIFARQEKHLVSGEKAHTLSEIAKSTETHKLFEGEQKVILERTSVKLTDSMMEGW